MPLILKTLQPSHDKRPFSPFGGRPADNLMRMETSGDSGSKQPLDELRVDESYRNTNNWKDSRDQFNVFFRSADGRGIPNAQGFRPKSVKNGSTAIEDCGFCLLVTNYDQTEWPDSLDSETGMFTYFGDNRQPGKQLDKTTIGGNRLLERIFDLLHNGDRGSICPFLCFENYRGADGTYMRFLGLAVPGAEGLSPR